MPFTPSKDMDSCKLDKTKAALACAALLGTAFDGLASALTSRSILAGDEIVHEPLTIEESGKACEALIKAVYGAAFDFIVEKVNQSTVGDRNENGRQVASIAADVSSSSNSKNAKSRVSCGNTFRSRTTRMS
jgi:myosin-5